MNVDQYIGKPWREGAAGPDAFDCWGLMQTAAADLYGLALPHLAATIAGRRQWVETARLCPGHVVALLDNRGHPYHVGLYVGGGLVLHTIRNGGARLEALRAMAFHAPTWKAYRWAG